MGPVSKTERLAEVPKSVWNPWSKGTPARIDSDPWLACHPDQIDGQLVMPSVPFFHEFDWVFGARASLSVMLTGPIVYRPFDFNILG